MKLDRIKIDPERLNGKATVRGLRLTVRRVVELVALYPERNELFKEYPELEEKDVQQALMFAALNLDDKIIELMPNVAA